LNQSFYYDERRLVAHLSKEDTAKQIASRLRSSCDSLKSLADSDSYYQCKQAAGMADELYRFCSTMRDALEDMQIEMRRLSNSVQETLEDCDEETKKFISRYIGMEEAVETAFDHF